MIATLLKALGAYPNCPEHGSSGCVGTAHARADVARAAARAVDLNRPWREVRQGLASACGLRVQRSTGHCFNDFNHVDCCVMSATHNTNEESNVVGIHSQNFLGEHIESASLPEHGSGGSWCTCQLSAPYDVCHRQVRLLPGPRTCRRLPWHRTRCVVAHCCCPRAQFGAQPAWKLVWCDGSGVAMVVDESARASPTVAARATVGVARTAPSPRRLPVSDSDGNVLARGKPIAESATVPEYGGAQARQDAWSVLLASTNTTWAQRWPAACRGAAGELSPSTAADGDNADEFDDSVAEDMEFHDEL